jgi:hypothetical protein
MLVPTLLIMVALFLAFTGALLGEVGHDTYIIVLALTAIFLAIVEKRKEP